MSLSLSGGSKSLYPDFATRGRGPGRGLDSVDDLIAEGKNPDLPRLTAAEVDHILTGQRVLTVAHDVRTDSLLVSVRDRDTPGRQIVMSRLSDAHAATVTFTDTMRFGYPFQLQPAEDGAVVRLYLVSSDWYIDRHDFTSVSVKTQLAWTNYYHLLPLPSSGGARVMTGGIDASRLTLAGRVLNARSLAVEREFSCRAHGMIGLVAMAQGGVTASREDDAVVIITLPGLGDPTMVLHVFALPSHASGSLALLRRADIELVNTDCGFVQCGAGSTLFASVRKIDVESTNVGVQIHDLSAPDVPVVGFWPFPTPLGLSRNVHAPSLCWYTPGVLVAAWSPPEEDSELTATATTHLTRLLVRHVPWAAALANGLVPAAVQVQLRALAWLRWRASQAGGGVVTAQAEAWATLPLEIFEFLVAALWDAFMHDAVVDQKSSSTSGRVHQGRGTGAGAGGIGGTSVIGGAGGVPVLSHKSGKRPNLI